MMFITEDIIMNMITEDVKQAIAEYQERLEHSPDKITKAEYSGFRKGLVCCFGQEIVDRMLKELNR